MNSRVEVLTLQEIEQIHAATVEVLETVGVEFQQEEALAVLRANGARRRPPCLFVKANAHSSVSCSAGSFSSGSEKPRTFCMDRRWRNGFCSARWLCLCARIRTDPTPSY